MALRLLGPLRWEPAGRPAQTLPSTLPVAILLVLARDGRWTSRTRIAALFWPDSCAETASLNLRVNVHKARQLLERQRVDVPLEADRRNLRWAPPVDFVPVTGSSLALAEGFELPGFDGFEAWLQSWRAEVEPAKPGSAYEDGPAADDDGGSSPAARDFFGRRLEVARLRTSASPAIVVTGEAGIGKSRLVATAFEPACWLRCREGLSGGSFAAVAELFLSHPAWLEDLGAYRLDVARLLPEVAPDEPLPPLDALTARVRLFEGLARAVEGHGTMLAVDDLQWADGATVEWLAMLAHRGRVRWVATARTDELPERTRATLRSLESSGVLSSLALQGLDHATLNALLCARRPDLAYGEDIPRAHPWLAALSAYTGGNPFFAIEVMDALTTSDVPRLLGRVPLPERVARSVVGRRDRLDAAARAVVDAASLATGSPAIAQLAAMAGLELARAIEALESAQEHGLMRATSCRHDLIRDALRGAIGDARAAELHRRAACHLADAGAEPELVAFHARQADDREAAWPWVLRAAQRLKQRGERDAVVATLSEVRDHALDPVVALKAEIMLAQEHLFDDLAAGRTALELALLRAGDLPRGAERRTLEAGALAGLVDNAVFSGDLARACALSRALRERMPGLGKDTLVEAHQVLIEASMREGDFAAARASLQGLREAGVARPVVLSFEAQIHWFAGAVREARGAFEALLERHPEYCHGLTIENDLAVMCHALGDLVAAEAMARRSLQSWACIAHTEALSSLVLGSTLTSMGRFDEALEALDRALDLGQRQGSCLFASEALARRARLLWCAGQPVAAREAIVAAHDGIGEVFEPLRASGLALMNVLTSIDADGAPDPDDLGRLAALVERSRHPIVHARHWRAQVAYASAGGDPVGAMAAARRQAAVARDAGLLEWLCEALSLVAELEHGPDGATARAQALTLASTQGFGWIASRLAATRERR